MAEDDSTGTSVTLWSQTGSVPCDGGAGEVAERADGEGEQPSRRRRRATRRWPWPATTRPRCGTRVNVVSPLRWLHSVVTDRIAMNGRMTIIGKPMASGERAVGELVVRRRTG